jgi:enoyl-CoA hydratase
VLDEYWHDETVAALVITGAGDKAFAAGADIAQLRERTSRDALKAINSGIFNRIEEFPAPVIAAIKGFALGGGCELAIACDLRVLGESAKLGQPEVKLGIIPAAGGTYRLPRLVGLGIARELVYTGRMVDAQEALRIGLANAVVPDAEVVDKALAMAARDRPERPARGARRQACDECAVAARARERGRVREFGAGGVVRQ